MDEVLFNGTDAQIRERFEAFARKWVVGSEAPLNPYVPKVRDEGALAEVMAAYDRMHGTLDVDGTTIQWAMEYDAERRHGREGRGKA